MDIPAIETVEGFLYAFGTVQADTAISYLAQDADIASLMTFIGAEEVDGTELEFRMLFALLSAQGYRHTLGDCAAVTGVGSTEARTDSGTTFSCPFEFYELRSGEMGLDPYDGTFVVAVRDGLVVEASWSWDMTVLWPQLWEPFADWVETEHPKDVAVMYHPNGGVRLGRDSALLWEVRTREYSRAVADAGTITGITAG